MSFIPAFLKDMEREVERSRRALAAIPDTPRSWKPHEKSMQIGYLADMVATIPTWFVAIVKQDELDIAPADGGTKRPEPKGSAEWVAALEDAAKQARAALSATTHEHLGTSWKLKARGAVVLQHPRDEFLRDTMLHWAHHRGQLTVYLRLLGANVPALYGPSADDSRFI